MSEKYVLSMTALLIKEAISHVGVLAWVKIVTIHCSSQEQRSRLKVTDIQPLLGFIMTHVAAKLRQFLITFFSVLTDNIDTINLQQYCYILQAYVLHKPFSVLEYFCSVPRLSEYYKTNSINLES